VHLIDITWNAMQIRVGAIPVEVESCPTFNMIRLWPEMVRKRVYELLRDMFGAKSIPECWK
jgi:hypothetical protein